ncbi:MAG: TadE/TadG family type IV pilus assembly protein [Candidatus Binataceae bacterium]|jgi:Flp pilus assembly protein TadG
MIEMAFALPVLLMLLTAAVGFAVVFDQQLQLTFAANAGAQTLSISRGQTTDPCQTTATAVFAAAPYLNQSNLQFTIVLGSTTVASSATNPSCSGGQSNLVQSNKAQVTLSYPCTLQIFGVSVPSCNLSAKTAASIQ